MKSLKCATYGDGLKIIDVESIFSRGLPGFREYRACKGGTFSA